MADIKCTTLASNIIKWSAGGTHGMKIGTNNHTHLCVAAFRIIGSQTEMQQAREYNVSP